MALEPFLRKYQSPKPLAPFLYDDLVSILHLLFQRILKTTVFAESRKDIKKLMALPLNDPKDPAFLAPGNIDIGFGSKRHLPNGASDLQKYAFFSQCKVFLMKVITKIIERCPLKFGLVRGLSSLNPATIASSPMVATKRFDTCLTELLKANRITSSSADLAKAQFSLLCSSPIALDSMKLFRESLNRLDSFWFSLVGSDDKFSNLWPCIRMLLTLCHGNAAVEGGFSVNESLLVENLHEQSLIAQRLVFDAVKTAGGVLKVKIQYLKNCYGTLQILECGTNKPWKSGGKRLKKRIENRLAASGS